MVNTVDPLGGSYFVEALTDQTEEAAMDYINRIDALGGVLACIQNGFFQREIAESAYRYQQEVDTHKRTIVGVNDYIMDEEVKVPTLYIDRVGEMAHLERLERVRKERDQDAVQRALDNLRRVAEGTENTMSAIIDVTKQVVALNELVAAERVVELLPEMATAAALRKKLSRLLGSVWSECWVKAKQKKRKPPEPKKGKRDHTSIFRLLQTQRKIREMLNST